VFTALGLFGLVIFIFCMIYPFFNKDVSLDVFCLAVLVGTYSSYLSEATLELQQGIVLVSLLYGMAYIRLFSKE
jgi:O-antigen ligase